MTEEKVNYVFNHYANLLTTEETLALRYHYMDGDRRSLFLEAFKKNGEIDEEKIEVLLTDGLELFKVKVAQRIVIEHTHEVYFNHCSICKTLARTPKAKQCRMCGYDWH